MKLLSCINDLDFTIKRSAIQYFTRVLIYRIKGAVNRIFEDYTVATNGVKSASLDFLFESRLRVQFKTLFAEKTEIDYYITCVLAN